MTDSLFKNATQPSILGVSDLRILPKIELHRHLEGAIRATTLVEWAKSSRPDLTVAALGQNLDENKIREHFLVRTQLPSLKAVLDAFLVTQSLLDSAERLERMAFEAVEDAHLEGIVALELRYSPTFISDGHSFSGWDFIVDCIQRGLEKAKAKYSIKVGMIGTIQRTRALSEAENVMDFFLNRKDCFVGVDLADNEIGFDPKPFQNIFSRAKKSNLGVTIHAGESIYPGSAQSVLDSVNILGATRIGHGIQIAFDSKVLSEIKKAGVLLEVCPTSNWITSSCKNLDEHPIKKLKEFGIELSINSDDPGVFGIDLTHEYDLLQKRFGFSKEDFNFHNRLALKHSFISATEKNNLSEVFK